MCAYQLYNLINVNEKMLKVLIIILSFNILRSILHYKQCPVYK